MFTSHFLQRTHPSVHRTTSLFCATLHMEKKSCAGFTTPNLTDACTIIVDASLQIKNIPRPGLNLRLFTEKANIQLLRIVITVLIIQLYSKQVACKAALDKRLFSATLNHCIFSSYLAAISNLAAQHHHAANMQQFVCSR